MSNLETDPSNEKYYTFLINLEHYLAIHSGDLIDSITMTQASKVILQYTTKLIDDLPVFIQSMNILKVIQSSFSLSIFYDDLMILYEKCCKIISTDQTLLPCFINLYGLLLSDMEFAKKFVGSKGFQIVFMNLFVVNHSTILANKASTQLFMSIPLSLYCKVDFAAFYSQITNQICNFKVNDQIAESAAVYIANLYVMMSNNVRNLSSYFLKINGLATFDLLLSNASIESKSKAYSLMLSSLNDDFSQPPNLQFLSHFHRNYKAQVECQEAYFKILIMLCEKNPQCVQRMHETVNFTEWFIKDKTEFARVLNLMKVFDKISSKVLLNCLPYAFGDLLVIPENIDNYDQLYKIIEHQLSVHQISLAYLIELNFLSAYLIEASPELLNHMFKTYESFAQLTLDAFSLQDATTFHESVFLSLMKLFNSDLPGFRNTCSAFLVAAPSQTNLKIMFDAVKENKHSSTLINSIRKSEALGNIFIEQKYFDEFEREFPDKSMKLIIALASSTHIDDFLVTLPQSHSIFAVDQKTAELVVYGKEKSEYMPIRNFSFYSKIPDENLRKDSYNSYLIGSMYGKYDFDRNTFVSAANQYISQENFEKIIQEETNYEYLCDTTYDNFTKLQIYGNTGFLKIDYKFQSIGFWIKLSDCIAEQSTIVTTDHLSIKVQGQTLTFASERETIGFPFEPNSWTSIVLSILDFDHIAIIVNASHPRIFEYTKLSEFSFIQFGPAHANSLIFIGPNIKLFDTMYADSIYSYGPSYVKDIPDHPSKILTPKSLLYKKYVKHKDSYCVPYLSFASHFSSEEYQNRLFSKLLTSHGEEYENTFHSLININQIIHIPQFFLTLFDIFIKTAETLKTSILLEAIDQLAMFQDYMSSLQILFNEIEIWKNVNSFEIVLHLFNKFPKTKWNLIPNFEFLLVKLVKQQPTNIELCKMVFELNEKVPKAAKILTSYLFISPAFAKSDIWRSITVREAHELQNTIFNALTQLPFAFIRKFINVEQLRALFIVSPNSLKAKAFHLMIYINELTIDQAFLISFASLINDQNVFDDLMMIKQESLFIPLAVSFVFAGSIIQNHSISVYGEENKVIKQRLVAIFKKLKPSMILNSEFAMSFIEIWFVFVLNYQVLYKNQFVNKQDMPPIQISDFTQAIDEVWKENMAILNLIPNIAPPTAKFPLEFAKHCIDQIFISAGYEIPLTAETQMISLQEKLIDSGIIDFFVTLLISSNQNQFHNLITTTIFVNPLVDNEKQNIIIPILIHRFLSQVKPSNPNINEFCNYILFILSLKTISLCASNVAHELLQLVTSDNSKSINSVLIELYKITPSNSLNSFHTVLMNNFPIFSSFATNPWNVDTWIFLFSKVNDPQFAQLVSKAFIQIGEDNSKYEKSFLNDEKRIEKQNLKFVENQKESFLLLHTRLKNLSLESTRQKFNENYFDFLIATLYLDEELLFKSSTLFVRDKYRWSNFVKNNLYSKICNLDFLYENGFFTSIPFVEKRSVQSVVKINYLYVFRNEIIQEKEILALSCSSNQVPCVFFLYKTNLVILFNASLTAANDDIVFEQTDPESLIKLLFTLPLNKTTYFNQRIAVKLNFTHICSIKIIQQFVLINEYVLKFEKINPYLQIFVEATIKKIPPTINQVFKKRPYLTVFPQKISTHFEKRHSFEEKSCGFMLKVNPSTCKLSIKKYFTKRKSIFSYVQTIKFNYPYFLLNFENGVSWICRILFVNSKPDDYLVIAKLPYHNLKVSFRMLLFARINDNELIISHFSKHEEDIKITFPAKLEMMDFDDHLEGLWVSEKGKLHFITKNGEIVWTYDNQITVFGISSFSAVFGTQSGELLLISDNFDVQTIDSPHLLPITEIHFQEENCIIFTIDSSKTIYAWTVKRMTKKPIPMEYIHNCAICGHKSTIFCDYCKRSICDKCRNMSYIGISCVTCHQP